MAESIDMTTQAKATPDVDLLGEFNFKVDGKGRVSIPAQFRDAFVGKTLVIARELEDDCLYLFTESDYNAWVEQLFVDKFGGYNRANKTHVKLRGALKHRARFVEIDGTGRIMVNADMRAAVGIEKDVVVAGNTGMVEIWAADRYQAVDDEIDLSVFYN